MIINDFPDWMVITSSDYAHTCGKIYPGGKGPYKRTPRKSISLILQSPENKTYVCSTFVEAAKIMGVDRFYLAEMLRARDIYCYKSGWKVVKKIKEAVKL
jgi:hypothetical protein